MEFKSTGKHVGTESFENFFFFFFRKKSNEIWRSQRKSGKEKFQFVIFVFQTIANLKKKENSTRPDTSPRKTRSLRNFQRCNVIVEQHFARTDVNPQTARMIIAKLNDNK